MRIYRDWKPLMLLVGMWNGLAAMENSLVIPHKTFTLNIRLTYGPGIPLLYIHAKKLKTVIQNIICTQLFIATLFTRAKRWK